MRCKYGMPMLAVLLLAIAPLRAQEKPVVEKAAPAETPIQAAAKKPPVPLTVTLVFSEFEGEKKISSLPYTLPVNAPFVASDVVGGAARMIARPNQLRMGVRVPIITTSTKDTNVSTVQYMDVGTNIDCQAWTKDGLQFEIELQAERSSLYAVGSGGKQVEWSPGENVSVGSQPIVRQYRSTMTLLLRDGQTVQRSMATDPLSGRQLKVDVTLNVVK